MMEAEPKETRPSTDDKAERAFQYFVALGPSRTLLGILERYKLNQFEPPSISTLKKWSSLYKWQDRIQAELHRNVITAQIKRDEVFEFANRVIKETNKSFTLASEAINQLLAQAFDEDMQLKPEFRIKNAGDLLKTMATGTRMFKDLVELTGRPEDATARRMILEMIDIENETEIKQAEAEGREPKLVEGELDRWKRARQHGIEPDEVGRAIIKAEIPNKIELAGKVDTGPAIELVLMPNGVHQADQDNELEDKTIHGT